MSDGSLSQEEIDALLAGTDELMSGSNASTSMAAPAASSETLSDNEKSTLLDVIRAATDAAASSLSTIISAQVGVGMMKVDVMGPEEIRAELVGHLVQVSMNLQDGISGDNIFVLQDSGAITISNMTMGQTGQELTDMALNALVQTMNQMYGAAASSMAGKLGKPVRFAEANAIMANSSTELTFPTGNKLARVSYTLKPEGQDQIQVTQIMPFKLVKEIVNNVMGIGSDMSFGSMAPQDTSPGFAGGPVMDSAPSQGQIGVANVQYPQFSQGVQGKNNSNIGLLMDVQMQLTVELGRTKMLIKDILGLGEGSIIELEKLAGEPVDLLVNQKLIAKGEVVVIDENFGVRVTEIVSPMERIDNIH